MNQAELTDYFIARPQSLGWFLGAGASRMSGLPTATDIIWDLKRRYYCREENQDVSRQDLQSRAVAERILSFDDARLLVLVYTLGPDGRPTRYADIASQLNCSEVAARKRSQRAVRQLAGAVAGRDA